MVNCKSLRAGKIRRPGRASPSCGEAKPMELALRLTLAVVFAWAGIAKLATLNRFAMVLGTHGVPRPMRRPGAVALAIGEITIGALLGAGIATTPVAIAAAVVSGVFALALVRTRLRGNTRSTCGCFGGRRATNTNLLVIRGAVIAAAAALLASGAANIAGPRPETLRSTVLAVLGILVIGLALAVVALFRQVGVLSLRLAPQTALELLDEGPAIGEPAPLLPELTRMGQELVAFVSLNCKMCLEVLPGLRALDRDTLPVHWVREDTEEDVFADWAVPGTPYVVYVVDGIVRAKGLVNTLEQIDWVLDQGAERQRIAA